MFSCRFLLISFFIFESFLVVAQDCPQYPLPCPHTSEIEQNRDFDQRMKDNVCFPQDIKMENDARNLLKGELERIAQKHQWKVYLVNENGETGPPLINVGFDDWEATPFNKRPPHHLRLSYILIINNDSLEAWRKWIKEKLAPDMQNQFDNMMKNRDNDPVVKKYQDSVKKYLGLYNSYTQSHAESFQKDIKNNNQKGLDAYQAKTQYYLDKSDFYQKKLDDAYTQQSAGVASVDENKTKMFAEYAQKSFVLIHFYINPYQAGFAISNPGQVSILPQTKFNIPGAFTAGIAKNSEELAGHDYELDAIGFHLQNPAWVGTVLFGKYLAKTAYNYYPAAFAAGYNKKENEIGTVKAIPGDKVQTLQVNIEGGKGSVNMLMKEIDWQKLRSMMYGEGK